MREKLTKKSRGFGFIVFENKNSVENLISSKSKHIINGKHVDCKAAIAKEEISDEREFQSVVDHISDYTTLTTLDYSTINLDPEIKSIKECDILNNETSNHNIDTIRTMRQTSFVNKNTVNTVNIVKPLTNNSVNSNAMNMNIYNNIFNSTFFKCNYTKTNNNANLTNNYTNNIFQNNSQNSYKNLESVLPLLLLRQQQNNANLKNNSKIFSNLESSYFNNINQIYPVNQQIIHNNICK